MSDLVHCQKAVEGMLSDGRPLVEVEEYIDDCSLGQMEKAGLWMLAWAHQDQGTQLRLARDARARQQLDQQDRLAHPQTQAVLRYQSRPTQTVGVGQVEAPPAAICAFSNATRFQPSEGPVSAS